MKTIKNLSLKEMSNVNGGKNYIKIFISWLKSLLKKRPIQEYKYNRDRAKEYGKAVRERNRKMVNIKRGLAEFFKK